MSVSKNTYGIVGYDITEYKDRIYTEENCKSDWYENLSNNQRVGNIQIFDDPMDGEYLYFGYIFFRTDESYESEMDYINLVAAENVGNKVEKELFEKFKIQISKPIKIIVFNEFT